MSQENKIKYHDTLPRVEQLAADLRGALGIHWSVVSMVAHMDFNDPTNRLALVKAAQGAAAQQDRILELIKQMTEC